MKGIATALVLALVLSMAFAPAYAQEGETEEESCVSLPQCGCLRCFNRFTRALQFCGNIYYCFCRVCFFPCAFPPCCRPPFRSII